MSGLEFLQGLRAIVKSANPPSINKHENTYLHLLQLIGGWFTHLLIHVSDTASI